MLINSDCKLSDRKLQNVKEYIHSENVMDSFTWVKKKISIDIRNTDSGLRDIGSQPESETTNSSGCLLAYSRLFASVMFSIRIMALFWRSLEYFNKATIGLKTRDKWNRAYKYFYCYEQKIRLKLWRCLIFFFYIYNYNLFSHF